MSETIPVSYLVESGQCSSACLLALSSDTTCCSCKCGGAYHGSLSDALVKRNKVAGLWYEPQDVVMLGSDEFVDFERGGVNEFNRVYRLSHGTFGAVIKRGNRDYQVEFDHQDSRSVASIERWEHFCRFCDALLLSARVRSIVYPTRPFGEYEFFFSATGIPSLKEATVIHDAALNLRYDTLSDWTDRFTQRLVPLIQRKEVCNDLVQSGR
ncbi:hypothetical protein [Bifidobacterium xylocopae]|uniref:hypothetical protein n=1 Tax=Bifidobacterium xylocopae TaxID=2493119 RepID=UPI000FDE5965|nr:hypothetical protein [Bifidobacterium xylocopae]